MPAHNVSETPLSHGEYSNSSLTFTRGTTAGEAVAQRQASGLDAGRVVRAGGYHPTPRRDSQVRVTTAGV